MLERNATTIDSIVAYIYQAKEHEIAQLNKQLKEIDWRLVKKVPNYLRVPKWDAHLRVLSIGNTKIRQWRKDAPNQFAILDAFEKAKWPQSIAFGTYPKHLRGQKMRDTLSRLNKYQKVMHFSFRGVAKFAEDEVVCREFQSKK